MSLYVSLLSLCVCCSTNLATVSCDLRNVVRTINELPDNYSGQIDILLNDKPIVTARNMAILIVLALSRDKAKAAEYAVHAWYSSFVPLECDMEVTTMWSSFQTLCMRNDGTTTYFKSPISDTCTMSGRLNQDVFQKLCKLFRAKHNLAKAQAEWNHLVYVLSLPLV